MGFPTERYAAWEIEKTVGAAADIYTDLTKLPTFWVESCATAIDSAVAFPAGVELGMRSY